MVRSQARQVVLVHTGEPPPPIERWYTRKIYKVFRTEAAAPPSEPLGSQEEPRQPRIWRLPKRDSLPVRLLWAILALQGAFFVTEIARLILTSHF